MVCLQAGKVKSAEKQPCHCHYKQLAAIKAGVNSPNISHYRKSCKDVVSNWILFKKASWVLRCHFSTPDLHPEPGMRIGNFALRLLYQPPSFKQPITADRSPCKGLSCFWLTPLKVPWIQKICQVIEKQHHSPAAEIVECAPAGLKPLWLEPYQ